MGQSFTGHHFSRMADPRDGGGHSESAPWRRNHNLEAAPIGGPLFAHGNSGRLCKASRFPLDTYATRLLAQALSLRFNQEEFWDGLYSVPKLLLVAVLPSSGALFERRVALGSARAPAFGPPGRSPAGFRRLRWR